MGGQDKKIQKQTEYIEDQLYIIKFELARKLTEVANFNKTVDERFIFMVKKLYKIKFDIDADFKEVRRNNQETS